MESASQTIAGNPAAEAVGRLLEQKALASTFIYSYLGSADGSFTMRPNDDMPADYDPRTRPWYKDAMTAGGTTLTEPYIDAATKQQFIESGKATLQGLEFGTLVEQGALGFGAVADGSDGTDSSSQSVTYVKT